MMLKIVHAVPPLRMETRYELFVLRLGKQYLLLNTSSLNYIYINYMRSEAKYKTVKI